MERHTITRLLAAAAPAVLVADAAWLAAGSAVPPPALGLAALLALLAGFGAVGFRLAGLLVAGEGPPARLTASVLVAAAAVLVPATALGHLGLLQPEPFLLWAAAAFLASRLLPRRPVGGSPFAGATATAPPTLRRIERAAALVTLTALALFWAVEIRDHRFAPPGYFGIDDNSYQLSTVATWMDEGDLAMLRPSYGDRSTSYYPVAANLVSWALFAPFGELDVVARWSQLPFALASLAVLLSIAARLGLEVWSAAAALALYASLERVFPELALGAGNDHLTAFATLAVADSLLRLARRPAPGQLTSGLHLGLALGLLAASKYLALLYLPPLAALSALAWLARRRAEPSAGGVAPTAAVAALAAPTAALVGGYTYLRNWVATGNPLFPSPLRLGGVEIFPGWADAALGARHHLPEFAIELPGFFLRPELWGPVAAWLLVPAAVAAPVAALLGLGRGRPVARRLIEAAALSLPAVFFLEFLTLVHDHRDVRYILAAIALAAVGALFLADRLEEEGGRAAALAVVLKAGLWIALLVHLGIAAELAETTTWVLAAFAAAGIACEARRPGCLTSPLRRGLLRPAVALFVGAALFGLALYVVERYPERKLENRPGPRHLAETLAPEGATVAYIGFNAPYLFWGTEHQQRIVVVPTACDLDSRLYRWGSEVEEPPWPFAGTGDFRCWQRNLTALGVEHLVVVRSGGEYPERRWLLRRPHRFRQVFQDRAGKVEIWTLERPFQPTGGDRQSPST